MTCRLIYLFLLFAVFYTVPAQAQNRLYLEHKTRGEVKSYSKAKKVAFILKDGQVTEKTRVIKVTETQIVCDDTLYNADEVRSIIVYAPFTKGERVFFLIPLTAAACSPLLYGHMDEGIILFWLLSAVTTPMVIVNIVKLCKRPPAFALDQWNVSVKKK